MADMLQTGLATGGALGDWSPNWDQHTDEENAAYRDTMGEVLDFFEATGANPGQASLLGYIAKGTDGRFHWTSAGLAWKANATPIGNPIPGQEITLWNPDLSDYLDWSGTAANEVLGEIGTGIKNALPDVKSTAIWIGAAAVGIWLLLGRLH